jgi:hypothetical protein
MVKMLSRKDGQFLIDLPQEWVDKVSNLLQESYMDKLADLGKEFQVFGKIYKSEVLIIASLIDPNNDKIIPTSYFVSMDLADGQDYTKSLDTLVDSIGAFYDHFFSSTDWMDYQDNWTDEEFKGIKIFYKANRENVALTIQADQLLNQ